MGQIPLAFLVLAGSILAFTDAPEQMIKVFDDAVLAGQQIATAGDLRSMSTMLDVHYLRRGRYPAEERFATWMAATFRENHLKDLTEDHWGAPYRYRVFAGGKAFLLQSAGVDGIFDTADDMRVGGP